MLEPFDRIWVIEKDHSDGEWITHSEIVIHHEAALPRPEEGWRIIEYVRVKEES